MVRLVGFVFESLLLSVLVSGVGSPSDTFRKIVLVLLSLSIALRVFGGLDEYVAATASPRQQGGSTVAAAVNNTSSSASGSAPSLADADAAVAKKTFVSHRVEKKDLPKGVYHLTDRRFLTIEYSYDSELQADVLLATSRVDCLMDDDTVQSVLDDLTDVLNLAASRHVHFVGFYDFRSFVLPSVSSSYARARQLMRWFDVVGHLIDCHIHSVVILLPSGIGARVLKSVVNFVIWVGQPPMGPRVFEDCEKDARAFARERVRLYREGELPLCKPLEEGQRYELPPSEEKVRDFKRKMEQATKKH